MKVMTYNVYRGGEDRLPRIQETIAQAQPDILAIQEACGWKESGRFDRVGDHFGFSDSHRIITRSNHRSSSARIYDLALYSRFPILEVKVYDDPETIWHSLLHVQLDHPLLRHVVVAHLSPKSEDWRLAEVKRVNELLLKHTSEPMVLLGDINSLSPYDEYPVSLAQQLEENDITKFGNPPRFDVVRSLLGAGWVDSYNPTHEKIPVTVTVTEETEDKDHLDLRLDYIFVNDVLADKIQNVSVIDTDVTRKASDHFPVSVEFSQ